MKHIGTADASSPRGGQEDPRAVEGGEKRKKDETTQGASHELDNVRNEITELTLEQKKKFAAMLQNAPYLPTEEREDRKTSALEKISRLIHHVLIVPLSPLSWSVYFIDGIDPQKGFVLCKKALVIHQKEQVVLKEKKEDPRKLLRMLENGIAVDMGPHIKFNGNIAHLVASTYRLSKQNTNE